MAHQINFLHKLDEYLQGRCRRRRRRPVSEPRGSAGAHKQMCVQPRRTWTGTVSGHFHLLVKGPGVNQESEGAL